MSPSSHGFSDGWTPTQDGKLMMKCLMKSNIIKSKTQGTREAAQT